MWDGEKVIGVVFADNLINKRPITDDQGRTLGLFASDLAHLYQRKLTEQALKTSEENYRLLIENQSDLVIKSDIEGRFLFVSPSYCRMFGKREDELLGKHFEPLIHEEDRQSSARAFEALKNRRESCYVEQRAMTKDGWRWLAWSHNAIRNKDGTLAAVIGVGRDMTERKKEEELLRISESAIASSTNAIAIVDLDGKVTSVNRSFLEAWGYESEREVLGNPSVSFWEDQEAAEKVVRTLREKGNWSGELTAVRKDGTLFDVHFSSSMVTDKAGKPICMMGSFVDMTERKTLEKAAMGAALKERQQIGRDLHDSLGQLLTGVAFLSKVMEDNLAKKSLPEASDAAKIARHIDESIALTKSLSRGLAPVKLTAGGLMNAIQELTRDTADLFGASCKFECPAPVLVPDVVVATHVFHIAQEAVGNAVRHGKARNVVVSLRKGRRGTITLRVSDDGIGIKTGQESNGLGLRSMRYRAGVIGGSLDIGSRGKGGTVVTCKFRPPGSSRRGGSRNDKG
jgi:PAS domain S-box-containing protein